ncbi:chromate transporter [Roseomonas sp. CAU 1739]|uniref:chromate transporter n=1 Tax=Roseomonas sp. CAU 1739 TaxID=3140364 RepID=UPI00325AA4C8
MTEGRVVTKAELFLGFLKIGMLGFGGIAPWARHVIIEERRWLTEKEFAAILGIGQVLPGPNTMNAAVMIGDRFQGLAGALLCVLGQLVVPLVIVTALGAAYLRFADVPVVQALVVGAAAGAAGLVMGTAVKMARNIRPSARSLVIIAAAFIAIGVMEWPLVPVVAVLVPLSIGGAALERRA